MRRSISPNLPGAVYDWAQKERPLRWGEHPTRAARSSSVDELLERCPLTERG